MAAHAEAPAATPAGEDGQEISFVAGDTVEITYTEALAIEVEEAPQK